MKRIGLIGTGKHGSRYANHIINDIETFSLVAVSRRSVEGEEQAREWGAQYFSDWRELVHDPTVDAIVAVATPQLNLDIARSCAEVGKPLLMEKPLARNGSEAGEVVRLMTEAGCPLTVGQTLRYNPVVNKLKEQLPELGRLHSLTVNQRIEPSTLAWHDDRIIAGAGVIIHTAVHVFDALKVITGLNVVRVIAASRCIHSRDLEDQVSVIAEFENGILGTIDVSKVGHARSGRYEFVCQDGQLHGDQIHSFTKVIKGTKIVEQLHLEQVPTIRLLLEDWADYLTGSSENPVTGEDGLYAVKVCQACLLSAESKRWVEVG